MKLSSSEVAKPQGGTETVTKEGVDSFGHKALGGVGEVLARQIEKDTGIETRSVVLSHLQRGGAPCALDRRMGRYYGIAAVDLIVEKKFGSMVCLKNGKISYCPLEKIYGRLYRVNPDTQYDPERYNGRRTILNGRKKNAQAQRSQRKI
jgi:ATP-dependent phosphofructokinase / diphosphate-dependent phosphofructokinase